MLKEVDALSDLSILCWNLPTLATLGMVVGVGGGGGVDPHSPLTFFRKITLIQEDFILLVRIPMDLLTGMGLQLITCKYVTSTANR